MKWYIFAFNISLNLCISLSFAQALSRLREIELQLRSSNLPQNSQALADHHRHLASLIDETATTPLHQGRSLLQRVGRDDPGVVGVRRQYEALEAMVAQLHDSCRKSFDSAAEAVTSAAAGEQLRNDCSRVQLWLKQIGEATLTSHRNMGDNVDMARDFLEIHERLHDDLMEQSDVIKQLSATAEKMPTAGSDRQVH